MSKEYSQRKIKKIDGELNLIGDKSISHRAVIISSLIKGESIIYGLSESDDCLRKTNIFKNMGVKFYRNKGILKVVSPGKNNFINPCQKLFSGNSLVFH